ncbi:MAG: transposase [Kiritimatiellia bacterium]
MARPLRLEYEGAIYHVMARGNERGAIFRLKTDPLRFIEKLAESAQTYHVRVYAYILMQNHWHALIETPRANISVFMQQFNTSYTTYYNARHQRVGHLYGGRYKSPLVRGDDYLLRLSRYIHLNPVYVEGFDKASRERKIERLRTYNWSSFPAYAGLAPRQEWMDYDPLRRLVAGSRRGQARAFVRFVEAGIDSEDEVLEEAMGRSSKAIGDPEFCRQVELELKKQAEELGAPQDATMRHVEVGTPPEVVEETVCAICRVKLEDMYGRRKKSNARAMLMKLLIEYSGLNQRAVAGRLGLADGSGVSRSIADLNSELTNSRRLQKVYRKAEKRIAMH